MAGDTDVEHAVLAVRGANAAPKGVISISAFGVVEKTVLLAALGILFLALVFVPECVASSSSVSCWLQAVGSGISESIWAILPADGSDSSIVIFARSVAKAGILIQSWSAS